MGSQEKITIREADLGPVIARADHWDGAIEVNKDIFYKLPPMVQEFVLCHEVCHLRHNEWDEARTNALASELYLRRAANEEDRLERSQFLSYLDTNGGYSNFAWATLITAAASLGYSIYGFIRERNAGWYSWDTATQQANLKVMLSTAFEKARKSGSHSAAEYFWAQLYPYDNKDADLEKFLGREKNAWVKKYIAKWEAAYGFGFDQVTPVDLTAYPIVIVAIGLVVGFIVYKIIKKARK